MKRFLFLFIFCILSIISADAQILTFDFGGITGNEASVASNSNSADISASSITRGSGLNPSSNADRFNSNNHATSTTIDLDHYVEFTITPNSGSSFSISSIQVKHVRSSTGPRALALRSSMDSYASNLGTAQTLVDNTNIQTLGFTFSMSDVTSATTFRLYSYNAENGSTGSGGPGDASGNDIVVMGSTVPVRLISFTSEQSDDGVVLNWQTASEINNDYFSIERSDDGYLFSEIARVQGNGTTNRISNYSFTDLSPNNGMNYYRLHQYDFDGVSAYSEVQSVRVHTTKSRSEFMVFPTICRDQLTVQFDSLIEGASLHIYNNRGQQVHYQTVASGTVLDISQFGKGTFFARLISGDQIQTTRFIKQ